MELFIGEDRTRVVVRDNVPLSENVAIHDQILMLDEDSTWEDRAKPLSQLVTAWAFEGDPTDIDSWGALDIFDIVELENKLAADIEGHVELRKRFPANEYDHMVKDFRQLLRRIHWRKRAAILISFVESTDLVEDWKSPDAWAPMSIFAVLAIEQAVTAAFVTRTARAKN